MDIRDSVKLTRVRIIDLVIVAAGLGIIGTLPGLASSSAEPGGGVFVDCGRALFGRPSSLPDLACASSYAPFDTVSILTLASTALLLLLAVGLLVRSSRGEPNTPGSGA